MSDAALERSSALTLQYARGAALEPRALAACRLRALDGGDRLEATRRLCALDGDERHETTRWSRALDEVDRLEATRRLCALDGGDPLSGTPYVVVRLLGQGGMGEVYEVEHRELGRRFAVKVLHRSHAGRLDLSARMRAEARSIARLRHRSLPEVFDLGTTADGRPYFAMELLDGRDLRTELARLGVVAIPTALDLVLQALSALSLAHAAGIVHRDIKLENLFLCNDGTLKLLDFGVAKLLHASVSLTAPDAVIGTPRTMSPEQCASQPIDPRADIYAMGLVLYELVAGRGPFDELRGQRDALRFAHCEREPPPPSRFAPQPIPPALERLILRAIAKAPEHRFQTAADMEAAVRRLRGAGQGDAALVSFARELTPTAIDAPAPVASARGDRSVVARRPPAASPRPGRAGAARPSRRSRARSRRCARTPQHGGRRLASRAGALGVCAIALASAALGLTLAQRWPAWGDPPAASSPSTQAASSPSTHAASSPSAHAASSPSTQAASSPSTHAASSLSAHAASSTRSAVR